MKTAIGEVPDFFHYHELATYDKVVGMRQGQNAVHLLEDMRPDLIEQLPAMVNPYLYDAKLPAFFDWLMDHWEDAP